MSPTDTARRATAFTAQDVSPAAAPERLLPGVLVVDDDSGVREVVAAWLTRHRVPVWLAANGPEAMESFRRHRAGIGVVLLDIRMPDQDGPDVLADLRTIDPDVRACFMTGDPGRHSDESLIALGALAVFPKPLHFADLAERLPRMAAGDVPVRTPGGFPTRTSGPLG